jgi:hypothetical protein
MRRKERTGAIVVSRSDEDLTALLGRYLEQDGDAFEAVTGMSAHDPEQCWRFLEIARSASLSDAHLAFLSAGPFEDMLKRHGAHLIARVEDAAETDLQMRTLLATVWRAGMSDDLWDRISALRTRLHINPL